MLDDADDTDDVELTEKEQIQFALMSARRRTLADIRATREPPVFQLRREIYGNDGALRRADPVLDIRYSPPADAAMPLNAYVRSVVKALRSTIEGFDSAAPRGRCKVHMQPPEAAHLRAFASNALSHYSDALATVAQSDGFEDAAACSVISAQMANSSESLRGIPMDVDPSSDSFKGDLEGVLGEVLTLARLPLVDESSMTAALRESITDLFQDYYELVLVGERISEELEDALPAPQEDRLDAATSPRRRSRPR